MKEAVRKHYPIYIIKINIHQIFTTCTAATQKPPSPPENGLFHYPCKKSAIIVRVLPALLDAHRLHANLAGNGYGDR